MVGKFYINIPKKDTNMVINFTPGKTNKYLSFTIFTNAIII